MKLTYKQEINFWNKVNKTDSCWIWTGSCIQDGYGLVGISYKTYLSHRVSWLIEGNTIPEGYILRNTCGNRKCVNTEHLETVLVEENWINRKLTTTQILAIRANTDKSQTELAKEYGVKPSTIYTIVNKKTWKSI